MNSVTQIIPCDGIGGVEIAARSVLNRPADSMNFHIQYIVDQVGGPRSIWALYNPFCFFRKARQVSTGDSDVIVLSLWRSSIIGLLAKLLRPRLQLVTFLHSAKDAHVVDFIVTRLSVLFSVEVWADSQATLQQRLAKIPAKNHRIISFVTQRFVPPTPTAVKATFIFWGRISKVKNLERSIRLFESVHRIFPDARFMIVGPDDGALRSLQDLCMVLGVEHAVDFLGPATHAEIISYARRASFYLQTSMIEGMAMSVVEAMQLGLVPVVTPVGEIRAYCKNDINAVIVENDQDSVCSVLKLLNSDCHYQILSGKAISKWEGAQLYSESFMSACEDLLGILNMRH